MKKRVSLYAANLIENMPFIFKNYLTFLFQDIENTIKGIRDYDVKYIFFDLYSYFNENILSEVSSKTGVKGLREDNILIYDFNSFKRFM